MVSDPFNDKTKKLETGNSTLQPFTSVRILHCALCMMHYDTPAIENSAMKNAM